MFGKLLLGSPLVLLLCLFLAGTARAQAEENAQSEEAPGAPQATEAEASDPAARMEELERRIAELEAKSEGDAAAEPAEAGAAEAEGSDEEAEAPAIRAHVDPIGANLSVYGAIWIDTGYISRTDERPGQFDLRAPYMQGRFVLGAQYYQQFKEKNFVLVKAAFIGFVNEFTKSQFEPRMEDVYIMVGQKWWDVQIGRYLAWEVYYRGQGIELFTAEEAGAAGGPQIYWLQLTRGYRDESGQMAVHFYPWGADCQGIRRYTGRCDKTFGIEISSVYGQELNQNNFGVRPAIDFQYKGLQIIAGYEFLKLLPQTDAVKAESTFHGVAGRLQYAADVVSVGAEYSWLKKNAIDVRGEPDAENSFDPWQTVGGYVNFRAGIHMPGLGYHYTKEENQQRLASGQQEGRNQHQGFASYLIKLPVKGLALKFVYGFGVANLQDFDTLSEFHNVMQSGRIRIIYDPQRILNPQDYP